MSKTEEMARRLEDIARIGVVNHRKDSGDLKAAAKLLRDQEERIAVLEERVAIMSEGAEQTEIWI